MKKVPELTAVFGLSIFLMPAAGPIDWQVVGAWALDFGRDLLFFLLIGLIAIWLFPKVLTRCSQTLRRSPVKSFFSGIAVLFAGYASILILFLLVLTIGIFFYVITFGDAGGVVLGLGLPAVGLAFGALNLTVAYLTKLVVAFLLGLILLEHLLPKALKHNFWPLLTGVVVYLLIRAIPWLGWAIGVAATLAGLGAIWLGWRAPRKTVEVENALDGNEQPVEALEQPLEESLTEGDLPAEIPTDQSLQSQESLQPEAAALENMAEDAPQPLETDPQSGD